MNSRMLVRVFCSLAILGLLVPASGLTRAQPGAAAGQPARPNPYAAQLAARLAAGTLPWSTAPGNAPCFVRRAAASGDSQVNCSAEDSPLLFDVQLNQAEPSVVTIGSKVVVAYNDTFTCCQGAPSQIGYSVSHDGGQNFTDMVSPPGGPAVVPFSDPSLAVDDAGNVWLETLAGDISHLPTILSELALWEMPASSDTFQLVSLPVIAGSLTAHFADKGLLAIGRDGDGREHFYITYIEYSGNFFAGILSQGPVELLDSTDAVNWRKTQLTAPTLCEPASPAPVPVPAGNHLYVSLHELDTAACTTDPTVTSGTQEVLTVDVPSATVINRSVLAPLHGAGDAVPPECGGSQVIETAPGLEARTASLSAAALDANGTLYVAWQDRPAGTGGGNLNATRIYLSYSTDGAQSWSAPQVISGPLSATQMADRYDPALVADTWGLHALWYERIANPGGGPDLIRADKADFTLAGPASPPHALGGGETALSTTPFPVLPIAQSHCYMGDYNQIASNGTRVTAAWTDARNLATSVEGTLIHQDDVFAQTYQAPVAQ